MGKDFNQRLFDVSPVQFRTPPRAGKALSLIQAAENLVPASDVRFPLELMYQFAHVIRTTDNRIIDNIDNGYHIYSVHFDSLSATAPNQPGMFAVRMHCGYKRFEEFVDRFGATITGISVYNKQHLHVAARVENDVLGWMEVTSVYYPEYLRKTENSVFEDIDSVHDLFVIYAILKDWKVAEGEHYREEDLED